jgi:hypothetical protein
MSCIVAVLGALSEIPKLRLARPCFLLLAASVSGSPLCTWSFPTHHAINAPYRVVPYHYMQTNPMQAPAKKAAPELTADGKLAGKAACCAGWSLLTFVLGLGAGLVIAGLAAGLGTYYGTKTDTPREGTFNSEGESVIRLRPRLRSTSRASRWRVGVSEHRLPQVAAQVPPGPPDTLRVAHARVAAQP